LRLGLAGVGGLARVGKVVVVRVAASRRMVARRRWWAIFWSRWEVFIV
jgi:hypothetical protein